MQPKLCLSLVLVVLFGALALGNPFLAAGAASPASTASSTAAAPAPVGEAIRDDAAPDATPATLVGAMAAGRPQAFAGSALAVAPARGMVALRSEAAYAVELRPACPDPDLATLVIAVEQVGGETVWVLRDGRRLVRNPIAGAQPLLVLFGDGK